MLFPHLFRSSFFFCFTFVCFGFKPFNTVNNIDLFSNVQSSWDDPHLGIMYSRLDITEVTLLIFC